MLCASPLLIYYLKFGDRIKNYALFLDLLPYLFKGGHFTIRHDNLLFCVRLNRLENISEETVTYMTGGDENWG